MKVKQKVRCKMRLRKLKGIPGKIKRDRQLVKYGYCDMDVKMFNEWFLYTIPDMIHDLRVINSGQRGYHGPAQVARIWKGENMEHALCRIEYLLRYASEDTCRKKNPYQEEYKKAEEEFFEKYGLLGIGREAKSEQQVRKAMKEVENRGWEPYSMTDYPEYREIYENYWKAEEELSLYRKKCLKKALAMMGEYFDDLQW